MDVWDRNAGTVLKRSKYIKWLPHPNLLLEAERKTESSKHSLRMSVPNKARFTRLEGPIQPTEIFVSLAPTGWCFARSKC